MNTVDLGDYSFIATVLIDGKVYINLSYDDQVSSKQETD